MCKYEMDPDIVEDTEQTQFGLQTIGWVDRPMDGRTDRQSETNICPSTSLKNGDSQDSLQHGKFSVI